MRIGSLFSGAGGLDLAVEAFTGATTVWQCEQDPDASKVLAARWGVPNLGDITAVDWHDVEPVDVLCGGFPCQDISNAGKRAGITGARSGLWSHYADAVRVLRPRHVYVENVGALLVRGLGTVLGDLAEMGYDASWGCVRASDAGAPHRRERVFIVATDADSLAREATVSGVRRPGAVGEPSLRDGDDLGTRGAQRPVGVTDEPAAGIGDEVVKVSGELFGVGVVGCGDGHGDLHGSDDDSRDREVKLLPTPTVVQGRNATSGRTNPDSEHHDGWTLNDIVYAGKIRLLPTPVAQPSQNTPENHLHKKNRRDGANRTQVTDIEVLVRQQWGDFGDPPLTEWGDYAAAVARWEPIIGRPAPEPVDGKGRLSPVFVEWLMGWPDGHVTGLDLKRTAELRICGNGVVPQQALLSFGLLEVIPGGSGLPDNETSDR